MNEQLPYFQRLTLSKGARVLSEIAKKVRFGFGKYLIPKEIFMRKSGVDTQAVQNEGINTDLAINVRGDPPKPSFALAATAVAWQTQAMSFSASAAPETGSLT
ncbi:MAG: hypothetical protein ABSC08_19760 [Bryobacteraceae bacterium]|jgi:hypothetical protein